MEGQASGLDQWETKIKQQGADPRRDLLIELGFFFQKVHKFANKAMGHLRSSLIFKMHVFATMEHSQEFLPSPLESPAHPKHHHNIIKPSVHPPCAQDVRLQTPDQSKQPPYPANRQRKPVYLQGRKPSQHANEGKCQLPYLSSLLLHT